MTDGDRAATTESPPAGLAAIDLRNFDPSEANMGDVRDPYTPYAKARAKHSVTRMDHFGAKTFMVYRYEHGEQVLRDDSVFSARINGKWMRTFLGQTILEMDGREHHTHRQLIGHAFRPRAVRSWEENLIRPTIQELLDAFAPLGRAELVKDFSWQMPVRVFARILGVPDVDYERWIRWAIGLERAAVDPKTAMEASKAVREYFTPVVEARRREPADDLFSDLVTAEIEGQKLSDDLIHGFLRLLVPAGAETTYRLLSNLMFGLLTHPQQLEAVRDDRSLIPAAVEEALRWEAPVQFASREALADVELGGVEIPEGAAIVVNIGSANHDETRWENPDAFDIHRPEYPNLSNMAFGDGPHRCLGEHLARLEASVALNALLDRVPDIRLDPGDRDPHILGYAFRSPNCVPVVFSPN